MWPRNRPELSYGVAWGWERRGIDGERGSERRDERAVEGNEGAGNRERGGKDRGLEGKEGDGGEQRSRMKMLALVNKTKDSLEKKSKEE